MNKRGISDPGDSEVSKIALHDIGHALSLLQLKLFNLQRLYGESEQLIDAHRDIDRIINNLIATFHSIIGTRISAPSETEELLIDSFIRQISRTISLCAGLNNNVTFDLRCPEAFIGVSSEEMLSTIINVISNSRAALKGQGNIVIETRYHGDSSAAPGFVDLSFTDDGVWTKTDPTLQKPKDAETVGRRTRRGIKSIKQFADKYSIKLSICAEDRGGTSVTFRIPLQNSITSSFNKKIIANNPLGPRRWKIFFLTKNEDVKFDIISALGDKSNDISLFDNYDEYISASLDQKPDISLVDEDIFFGMTIDRIIHKFTNSYGQIFIFVSRPFDPALIHSNAIIFSKPIDKSALQRTIAAVKVIRFSAI